MHASVLAWVGQKALCPTASVLEVGSFNVNGSVRQFFSGPYVGVDMRPGPGVDVVAPAAALPFDDEFFDVVVSTEMLEHDPSPWRSMPEMARVLKHGGFLLVTARGIGFPLHEFPADYWRFTTESFRLLFGLAGIAPLEITEDPDPASPGVFGLAQKG